MPTRKVTPTARTTNTSKPAKKRSAATSRSPSSSLRCSAKKIAFVCGHSPKSSSWHTLWPVWLSTRAQAHGYKFEHHSVTTPDQWPSLAREMRYRGVRGVVFANLSNPAWQRTIRSDHLSMVWLGGMVEKPFLHTIKSDVADTIERAVAALSLAGASRIGLVCVRHEPEIVMDDAIRDTVMNQCRARHPQAGVVPLLTATFRETTLARRLQKWHESHSPEVVISLPIIGDYLAECCSGFDKPRMFCSLAAGTPALGTHPNQGFSEMEEQLTELAIARLDSMIRFSETGLPSEPAVTLVRQKWIGTPLGPFGELPQRKSRSRARKKITPSQPSRSKKK